MLIVVREERELAEEVGAARARCVGQTVGQRVLRELLSLAAGIDGPFDEIGLEPTVFDVDRSQRGEDLTDRGDLSGKQALRGMVIGRFELVGIQASDHRVAEGDDGKQLEQPREGLHQLLDARDAREHLVVVHPVGEEPVGRAQEIELGGGAPTVSALAPDALDRRLVWRERMVALDGQSLREAAAEVTRFSGVRFAFADTATAQVRLAGYVAGDDVEAFLELLENNVGVSANRRADGVIVLRSN